MRRPHVLDTALLAAAFAACHPAHVDAPKAGELMTNMPSNRDETTSTTKEERIEPSTTATTVVLSTPPEAPDVEPFEVTPAVVESGDEEWMACVRAHESDTSGGYGAVSPDGRYHGAYQFDARTWSGAVSRAGYPEYAGTPADQAPPAVQDAAARQLYSERGLQPWSGTGCSG